MTIEFKIYAFVSSLTSLVTRTYFLNINFIIIKSNHLPKTILKIN